ncbi:MAG: hypothetical protein BWY59_01782 [Verrucomicrobia bacterium ADurb.Bin345]|nr:MAG: hypothetical protein BWY59_01782 [Verrucomicrobia bacterium ADurb.Bin345]
MSKKTQPGCGFVHTCEVLSSGPSNLTSSRPAACALSAICVFHQTKPTEFSTSPPFMLNVWEMVFVIQRSEAKDPCMRAAKLRLNVSFVETASERPSLCTSQPEKSPVSKSGLSSVTAKAVRQSMQPARSVATAQMPIRESALKRI